jgi:hypothetical protein
MNKDRSLSVTTGSDVFGPTDINTMAVNQDEGAEVSGIPRKQSAWTNVTCSVHQAPQMMPQSHAVAGVYGLYPMQSILMPRKLCRKLCETAESGRRVHSRS